MLSDFQVVFCPFLSGTHWLSLEVQKLPCCPGRNSLTYINGDAHVKQFSQILNESRQLFQIREIISCPYEIFRLKIRFLGRKCQTSDNIVYPEFQTSNNHMGAQVPIVKEFPPQSQAKEDYPRALEYQGWTGMYTLVVPSLSTKFIKNSHQNLPV